MIFVFSWQELEYAMVALGFRAQHLPSKAILKRKEHLSTEPRDEMIESLVSDGTVTFEEFSSLMTGAIVARYH